MSYRMRWFWIHFAIGLALATLTGKPTAAINYIACVALWHALPKEPQP